MEHFQPILYNAFKMEEVETSIFETNTPGPIIAKPKAAVSNTVVLNWEIFSSGGNWQCLEKALLI